MNDKMTELVMILDKSGSMSGLEKDTIGGYNAKLEKQKAQEGSIHVTTVLFDHHIEILHDRLPIGCIEPLTEKEYQVGGMTALLDAVGTVVALACFSLPTFFFASLLKLVFCVHLGWFDLGGLIGRHYEQLDAVGKLLDKGNHLVLPIVTLVVISIGSLMRYTRTNMLEVLNADYIRTARAKGLSENKVIYHHAFRNTLIPLVTMLGGSLPGLFAGALITETLYSIPGIGYVSYQSMVAGDIPFSMFYLVFMAILTLLGNLISDILYAVVDPRVRIA